MNAIIFVVYHPSSLPYFNLLKNIYKDNYKVFLIVANHPYFTESIKTYYFPKFDNVIELEDIDYKINIIKGYYEIKKYINNFSFVVKLKIKYINRFIIFTDGSAYLPVNIILSLLTRDKRHLKTYKIFPYTDHHKDKKLIFPTLIIYFYSIIFKLFAAYKYRLTPEISALYLYEKDLDFSVINIEGYRDKNTCKRRPNIDTSDKIISIHLDRKITYSQEQKVVIVFGEYILYNYFKDYMPSHEIYSNLIRTFFKQLIIEYKDCKIIYKGHPKDGDKYLPGSLNNNIIFSSEAITSEMLIDKYLDRIIACYTISSTSLRYSSLNSIPSYFIFDYLAPNLRKVYNAISTPNNFYADNKYIFYIKNIEEIGTLDSNNYF